MTRTKGNVIVENIQIGDIHYEFEYGVGIKLKVLTLPVRQEDENGDGYWTWQSELIHTGAIINYHIVEKYAHYSPNLYDYEAYQGCKII
jgi:hypothetical protein